MKTLRVALPNNSYNIHISAWDIQHSVTQLKKLNKEDRIFIITNHTIKKLYQKKIERAFSKHLSTIWISIADGERYKNLKTCETLLTKLSQKNANRNSAILALGGGVVGDIAGFVAASYMRGIPYFQMPTTLLSQVDSSVGGKTGVDLKTGKNLVGSFYQPKAVFIHTDFLKTLPKREFKCGMAEVIKYGIIRDAKLFKTLIKNKTQIQRLQPTTLTKVIYRCCQIKAEVVRRDEKESHLRAILNFGHTLAHAIEVINDFKRVKHGEAVAMGMVFAASFSYQVGFSKTNHKSEIKALLKAYGLPCKYTLAKPMQYYRAIQKDKKATGRNIKFILLKKIGKVEVVPIGIKDIVKWIC